MESLFCQAMISNSKFVSVSVVRGKNPQALYTIHTHNPRFPCKEEYRNLTAFYTKPIYKIFQKRPIIRYFHFLKLDKRQRL